MAYGIFIGVPELRSPSKKDKSNNFPRNSNNSNLDLKVCKQPPRLFISKPLSIGARQRKPLSIGVMQTWMIWENTLDHRPQPACGSLILLKGCEKNMLWLADII